MLKKFLAVAAGLLVGAAVVAAEVELRDGHPDVYTVQKGDTLWDISARFLKQPWLWPEIWHANPQVKNPHLIYPGDRLSLEYVEGRPQLVATSGGAGIRGDGKLTPHARAESLDGAVTAVPLSAVQPFIKRMRLLSEEEAKGLPYVLANEESRLFSTQGRLAYVRGLRAHPGARVVVVRPTVIYRDVPEHFPWDSSERKVETEEWAADLGVTLTNYWKQVAINRAYRRQTEVLGYEVLEIGDAEVLHGGDPATLLIKYSDVEVRKGDLVMVEGSLPFDLVFNPHAPKKVPDNMRVMAFTDALEYVGPHQVVALSKGARDGIENGQVFAIFHPGDVVRDTIKYPENDLRTQFSSRKAKVQLPEEYIGHVMVFRTFNRISYGLVMDGVRPVSLYDRLHGPDTE